MNFLMIIKCMQNIIENHTFVTHDGKPHSTLKSLWLTSRPFVSIPRSMTSKPVTWLARGLGYFRTAPSTTRFQGFLKVHTDIIFP